MTERSTPVQVVTGEKTFTCTHPSLLPFPLRLATVPGTGGVDSRLTATLQAILVASRFLDRGDADVINNAARVALDCAAAAAAAAEGGGETHAAEDSQSEEAVGVRREWPGPNLAAMSLLALLHVSQKRWEGIPAALDVLQQMVSERRREGEGESKYSFGSSAVGPLFV